MSAIAPKPGESLVGLISRAARHNHLPRLRALLSACTTTWHAHFNLASREDMDFGQLAHAARLAPHDVESRRYRTVALTPDLPGTNFHGANIPAYDLQLRSRRLATSWLMADPFHCALGHHALATHCPITGHFLIERCPRCDARLTWSGLDLSHCGVCSFDLADAEPQCVTERELIDTRLMLDLVHPDPTRHRAAIAQLPKLLSGLNRGTIFELGWRFGDFLRAERNGPRIAARHLPVAVRLQILEVGSKFLAAWPDSIRSAMQGVAPGFAIVDPKLPNAVRSIAKAGNAWPEIREAIFAAVPGLAVSARKGVKSVMPKSASAAELTKKLGVSQRVFERMRDADTFLPVSASGVVKRHEIFDARQTDRLRALFADRTPLGSASERLGISIHGVEQLCCLGDLQLLDDEVMITALKDRQITMSSLETLRSRLDRVVVSPNNRQDILAAPVQIHRALRAFGGREKPWGTIVHAMLAGELSFLIDRDVPGRLIDRISVSATSVPVIAGMRFETDDHPTSAFDPRINGRDAEEMLNVGCSTFSRAVKNGELPARCGGIYSRTNVLALASKMISASEMSTRWAENERRLPKPLKGAKAPIRIGQLGWDRSEVEEVMAAGLT